MTLNFRLGATAALFSALLPAAARAQSNCTAPMKQPITMLNLPGTPFQALPSKDGCWLYVSFPKTTDGSSAIGLVKRSNGALTMMQTIEIKANPTGMVLTHDGKTLIVAATERIAFIDAQKLITAPGDAYLGFIDEPGRAPQLGRIYANITKDDKYLFVADERALTISVIDMAKARASKYAASSIVGQIPTGTLPIAVTFSNDETLMYATSQWAPASYGWPIECKREGAAAGADTTPVNPQGAIHIIDVTKAKTDPAHSIVGSVPAGCSTVRLVLSPSGDRAYVTARNSNALLAFDTGKLRSDPSHALIGRVPVGTAPVGVAVIEGGRKVIVTNSNRFGGGGANDKQFLTVVDATKIASGAEAIIGSIPAGGFPREMRVTPDGTTLILTNFASSQIEAIDLTHLPIEPPKRQP